MGAHHFVETLWMSHVSAGRASGIRAWFMLIILRYVLLQIYRRPRNASAWEVAVSSLVLGANSVNVLRARPLHTLFLNFVAHLPAAELLRVLLTVTLHALRAA